MGRRRSKARPRGSRRVGPRERREEQPTGPRAATGGARSSEQEPGAAAGGAMGQAGGGAAAPWGTSARSSGEERDWERRMRFGEKVREIENIKVKEGLEYGIRKFWISFYIINQTQSRITLSH